MQSKRDGLVPIGEVVSDLDGPVQAIHTKAYAGIRLVSCPRCRSSGWH